MFIPSPHCVKQLIRKVGALLTNVFKGNVTADKDLRYISGNVLTGKKVSPNGFLVFVRPVSLQQERR